MTNRLPQTTPRKMIKALKKLGFVVEDISGSHYHLCKGAYNTLVPYHSHLSRRLQMNIIKQAGLTTEEIRPYL
jgi:predicted RNA binding protein YcfA (HicA-like mRNA interferase family)